MTDKEKSARDDLKMKIEARKEVLKKIENPFKRLQAQADKNFQKRKDKMDAAKTYSSVEEAREMWGYDAITEDELHDVERFFEEGEDFIANRIPPQEYAVRILGEFVSRLRSDIRSFEFELLPMEEQIRLLQEQEERREKVKSTVLHKNK